MAPDTPEPNEIYQTATMEALLDGVYDGDVTIRELLTHGDFGLGTFNGLDGEMLMLDSVCYQLRSDGSATKANPPTNWSPSPWSPGSGRNGPSR